jgi:alcohol dehydrogenase, propanol-preferring
MVFEGVGRPLRLVERPVPQPGPGQLLLKVHACGVCRTDLHLLDGEVEIADPPRILGHQIVGTVVSVGEGTGVRADAGSGSGSGSDSDSSATGAKLGDRVGVPWLGWTDGECEYCTSGRENLCPRARFTGRDIDGGYAQYTLADERYCFAIPDSYSDEQAAPLLCAGLIGYRALRMCGDAQRVGFYGFGDAAHILTQICRGTAVGDGGTAVGDGGPGREVYAFTRPGDEAAQSFARELGAVWAGSSEEPPPQPLDAAIIFAPVGALVPLALRATVPGGVVVCGGIHMSDIPSFPYSILWEERVVRSVANLTRRDGEELLALAPRAGVQTRTTAYPLTGVGEALEDLRAGQFTGAAVIVP